MYLGAGRMSQGYTHPLMKILPPFFYELLAYLIGLALLYQLGAYLWSQIK
jgi:hypothetical protein